MPEKFVSRFIAKAVTNDPTFLPAALRWRRGWCAGAAYLPPDRLAESRQTPDLTGRHFIRTIPPSSAANNAQIVYARVTDAVMWMVG
jgi:hypothetical protein